MAQIEIESKFIMLGDYLHIRDVVFKYFVNVMGKDPDTAAQGKSLDAYYKVAGQDGHHRLRLGKKTAFTPDYPPTVLFSREVCYKSLNTSKGLVREEPTAYLLETEYRKARHVHRPTFIGTFKKQFEYLRFNWGYNHFIEVCIYKPCVSKFPLVVCEVEGSSEELVRTYTPLMECILQSEAVNPVILRRSYLSMAQMVEQGVLKLRYGQFVDWVANCKEGLECIT